MFKHGTTIRPKRERMHSFAEHEKAELYAINREAVDL